MKAISNHNSLQSGDYPVLNSMHLKYYTFHQTAQALNQYLFFAVMEQNPTYNSIIALPKNHRKVNIYFCGYLTFDQHISKDVQQYNETSRRQRKTDYTHHISSIQLKLNLLCKRTGKPSSYQLNNNFYASHVLRTLNYYSCTTKQTFVDPLFVHSQNDIAASRPNTGHIVKFRKKVEICYGSYCVT